MSQKKQNELNKNEKPTQYRTAKMYEIILFATNNTATNFYNFMMGYVTYYAVGVAGLAVFVVSTLLTAMRIFDGVVDPLIGYIIDKTDGKFGKFRPYIWLGNAIMIATILLLFQTTHLVPENWRLIYFLLVYGVYIIGYSLQTTVTKTGQNVITNDPKQRPLFSMFDGIFTTIFYSVAGIYVSNYLSTKYNGVFGQEFFTEFSITFMIGSLLLTVLATIGIWKKDRTEYYGLGDEDQKDRIKLKEYVKIAKENRPLQMLTLAASTDKLGSKIKSNSISGVLLFGIIIGDYGMMGIMSALAIIPGILFNVGGSMVARKIGQKKTYVFAQGSAFIVNGLMALLILFGDAQSISVTNLNLMSVLFIGLHILGTVQSTGDAMQISMISDVTDYETARSGSYVPGLIGSVFSFVDNFFSSFSNSIVGFIVALAGYTTTLPEVGDPSTPLLLVLGVGLYFGGPMIGWLCSLIAMKFYSLDGEKMGEVQETIQERKEKGLITEDIEEVNEVIDDLSDAELDTSTMK
jgi:Na+/melibiose symporter-like transporter